jgi:hypothetical protein
MIGRSVVAAMKKLHYLYFVDLEYKTAFCSVCGPTDIYLRKSRTDAPPKAICLNRLKASQQAEKQPTRGLRRTGPKPLHPLSEIDEEKLRAVCAVCGPTDIRKRAGKKYTTYSCANRERGYGRKYRRSHYIARTSNPFAHTLSEIDEVKKTAVCSRCGPVEINVWRGKKKINRRCINADSDLKQTRQNRKEARKQLIAEYKVQRGCQRCGYNANPLGLELHPRNPDQKHPQMGRLLQFSSVHLPQELENYDVLCAVCHRLTHNGLRRKRKNDGLNRFDLGWSLQENTIGNLQA